MPTFDNPARQPSLFIPHGGGPCFFMKWTMGPPETWEKTRAFLESIQPSLPERPRALLVVSGHWEEDATTASAAPFPELIYDYSGFPAETYQLTWPAPGSPELAGKVQQLLQQKGLSARLSATRGYDHGVFIPLKVAFPAANIPVVSLSLESSLDPALHLAVGDALAPLRNEGVLIVGSGMSFHNLRALFTGGALEPSREFDTWLEETIESPVVERNARLKEWKKAPQATFAHPREEHLIPLMVAAGAGGNSTGKLVFRDSPMNALVSAYRWD
ncbi:MAG TPA: class III extradiol ring-cleavage dioxygenase [Terriglobales bacterium]|nr:class III extradiol ring-cleavage dioxygenase [Terriglobales bacterium]